MLNLLLKDFKLMFSGSAKLSERIISAVFTILFVGCFVAVEWFVFRGIISKISDVAGAKETFLCVFLFVITVLLTVSCVMSAKKLFFDPKDVELLSNRPVQSGQIISSKLVLLFLVQTSAAFLFEYPLFIAYGVSEGMPPMFYFTALFYPALSFVTEAGVALLAVYPVYLVSCALKNHPLIKLLIASVVMSGLAVAYSSVLEIFVNLVSNNGMAGLFTSENMAKLQKFKDFAFPVNTLMSVFIGKEGLSLLVYLLISSFIFAAGIVYTVFSYNYVRNVNYTARHKRKERKIRVLSVGKSLVKKELLLIFGNSENIFSYTGLIIIQPFLLCMVLKSINTAFNSGAMSYYINFIPGFVAFVDAFFVMIFSTTIAGGANRFISMEEKTVKNMKTMPVNLHLQLAVKAGLPFVLSAVSLIVTIVVLLAAGVLGFDSASFCLLLGICALALYDVASLYEELKIRRAKSRKTLISSAVSYLMPLLFAVFSAVLSYSGISPYVCFAVGSALYMAMAAAGAFIVYKISGRLFLELEAIN